MTADDLRRRIQERLKEQRSQVRLLLQQREQLRGSLFARYGVCGKEGCACRTGRRHGPYYVLSVGAGGAGSFRYLSPDEAGRARQQVERYKRFRTGMRRLRTLNEEIVRLLKRYQASVSRGTGRRFRVAGQAKKSTT
jgi:Family of unknown function (DUF6788)